MSSVPGRGIGKCNCCVYNACEIKIGVVSDIHACNVLYFIRISNRHGANTHLTEVDGKTHKATYLYLHINEMSSPYLQLSFS